MNYFGKGKNPLQINAHNTDNTCSFPYSFLGSSKLQWPLGHSAGAGDQKGFISCPFPLALSATRTGKLWDSGRLMPVGGGGAAEEVELDGLSALCHMGVLRFLGSLIMNAKRGNQLAKFGHSFDRSVNVM